jgi:hypothetical protein
MCNLSEAQRKIVEDLQTVLKPFMIAQKLLEGQSYATISLIPFLIFKVRKNLHELQDSPHSSPHVLSISRQMAHKLEDIFGSGVEGTVANEILPEGPRRGPREITILVLMASLLDPRTKGGVGIPQADQEFTYVKIKEAMIIIAQQLDVQLAPYNNNNNNDGILMLHQPQAAHHQDNDIDAMFKELNDFYAENLEGRHNINENNNNNIQQQQRVNVIKAELLLYKEEPAIRLYQGGNEGAAKFICPLTWWQKMR